MGLACRMTGFRVQDVDSEFIVQDTGVKGQDLGLRVLAFRFFS